MSVKSRKLWWGVITVSLVIHGILIAWLWKKGFWSDNSSQTVSSPQVSITLGKPSPTSSYPLLSPTPLTSSSASSSFSLASSLRPSSTPSLSPNPIIRSTPRTLPSSSPIIRSTPQTFPSSSPIIRSTPRTLPSSSPIIRSTPKTTPKPTPSLQSSSSVTRRSTSSSLQPNPSIIITPSSPTPTPVSPSPEEKQWLVSLNPLQLTNPNVDIPDRLAHPKVTEKTILPVNSLSLTTPVTLSLVLVIKSNGTVILYPDSLKLIQGTISLTSAQTLTKTILESWEFSPTTMGNQSIDQEYQITFTVTPNP